EEDFHADLFTRVAKGNTGFKVPAAEKKFLYSENAPVWKLLAYCYLGEAEAVARFRSILRATKEPALRASLARVIGDESGHVGGAYEMLESMGASRTAIRLEILRIKLVRRYQAMQRMSKRVLEFLVDLTLSAVYYFCGVFIFKSARRKMAGKC